MEFKNFFNNLFKYNSNDIYSFSIINDKSNATTQHSEENNNINIFYVNS